MFRVVNGQNLTDEQYQIFTVKYNNGVKIKDIMKDMDLTYNQYRKLLKMGVENKDIIQRKHSNKKARGKNTNAKYYYYNKSSNRYVVKNPITRCTKSFINEVDAKNYVEKIRENNWKEVGPNRRNVPYNSPNAFLIEVEIEYNRNNLGYFRVKDSVYPYNKRKCYEYRYRDESKKYHKLFAMTIEDLKEKVLSNNLPWMSRTEMKDYLDKEKKL